MGGGVLHLWQPRSLKDKCGLKGARRSLIDRLTPLYQSVNQRLVAEAVSGDTRRRVLTQECADGEPMARYRLSPPRRREDIRTWRAEHMAAQRKLGQTQAAYCRAQGFWCISRLWKNPTIRAN